MKLTVDQKKALKAFKSWLESSDEGKPFVLSGYAGSGKTFLSGKFLKLVEEKDLCWTVVAPTHKAVGVLRQALNMEGLRPTWYPSTIHRLLRLKLKRQGHLEVCEKTDQTMHSLEQLSLILIDEASMVDSKLLEITLHCAHPYKTRLVFVGDPSQLPPVGEHQSPVFSMKRACNAHLNKVVRHRGPVLELASRLREGRLPSHQPPLINTINTEKGSVGFLDRKSWLIRAKEEIKAASLNNNPDSARILCYTNRTLESLVPHARRAIHGEMADQLPVLPGEVLITRAAVMAPASSDGSDLGEEPDMLIGSNRELVVSDVIPEKCDLTEFGFASESDWNVPIIKTLTVKVIANELQLSLRLLPPVGTEPRDLLDKTLKRLRAKANEEGKGDRRILWRKFFLLRDAFASLGPASVLTVHRSQGSSFGNVFIAEDIFWPKDMNLRKQLVYVAVSRAIDGVWIVGCDRTVKEKILWQDQLT